MPQAFIIMNLPQLHNAKLWRPGEALYFQMEGSQASASLQEIHGTKFSTCGLWNASQIEELLLLASVAVAQGKHGVQTNLQTIPNIHSVIARNGDQLFGAKYAYNMQNNFQNWHIFKWVVCLIKFL